MLVAILSVLLICALVLGYVMTHSAEPPPEVDSEQALKAAVDLHRIRRDLDVARAKSEQRRNAQRMRRTIDRALKARDK
jgi:Tfp pilus assembly protein PilN